MVIFKNNPDLRDGLAALGAQRNVFMHEARELTAREFVSSVGILRNLRDVLLSTRFERDYYGGMKLGSHNADYPLSQCVLN
ncbi:MAG: hypothetical protein A3C55_01650 [Gammaproteobacteria bacterium RIFCSPHIGHO2_02_FULL_42_13]|nr:MAG: hypothetical protein A3C55_01650 [Gammaproteobacteria bacterium RIFCSPHIGHO2_02_FULL_42_13]OGT70870.1 MAG: hypothetical protein A3H43_00960 [Gammaproteobacteria bacterium RIFCSPLOWO2_02_FULL_42_9]